MPEQTTSQEKMKDKESDAAEAPVKQAMFSKKGLMILVVALMLEGIVAAVLSSAISKSSAAESPKERDDRNIRLVKKDYIEIDGPVVTVPRGVGGHETLRIATISIEVDPELSDDDRQNLEESIKNIQKIIRQKLEDHLIQVGYERLLQAHTRQVLQNRLKEDIIRFLGVTEREIREVMLDPPVF